MRLDGSVSDDCSASKDSSQPTSTRILTPPSSSSSDCDAADSDWAPNSGVKVNMAGGRRTASVALSYCASNVCCFGVPSTSCFLTARNNLMCL
ncbi:hypothetical protein KCU81_g140, partial [Aureobasidium melanogenum]